MVVYDNCCRTKDHRGMVEDDNDVVESNQYRWEEELGKHICDHEGGVQIMQSLVKNQLTR